MRSNDIYKHQNNHKVLGIAMNDDLWENICMVTACSIYIHDIPVYKMVIIISTQFLFHLD